VKQAIEKLRAGKKVDSAKARYMYIYICMARLPVLYSASCLFFSSSPPVALSPLLPPSLLTLLPPLALLPSLPQAEQNYEALKKYGHDLVGDAEESKLDPVVGRDEEIRRVIQVERGRGEGGKKGREGG